MTDIYRARPRLRRLALLLGAALIPALAAAQFPDRTVRLVVPYAAGGAADLLARSYADKLKEQIGQTVVVENRPGATGSIGTDAVVKAPADGYTLVLNSSAVVINPWLFKQPFDVLTDLTPVARTAETPYVVFVGADLPVQNLDEFIAYARDNPGKLACSTYGNGSPTHLALELLKKSAGLDILHIPYKTFAQALPDLFSGQLGCSFDLPTVAAPFVQSGKLRAIAHTGVGPMTMYPQAEPIGKRYPSATVIGWQAVFARSSTPAPVIERLRTEWDKVVSSPDVQQRIRESGYMKSSGTISDFEKELTSDHEKFGKVIKETGIRLE